MRKILPVFIMLLVCVFPLASQTAVQPAGSGTQADPYQIATLDNLYWVTQNSSSWGSYFIQTADIDASSTNGWDGSAGFSPIGSLTANVDFTGSYDGQKYTISGLYIYRAATDYIGMFGRINGGSVSNLTLSTVNITGANSTGALAGVISGGATVSNCHSSGSISGAYNVGGLIGLVSDAGTSINNSSSSCSVSGTGQIGGFIGYAQYTVSINNCFSTGAVSGDYAVGGFVGYMTDVPTVSNCYATGSVTRNNGSGSGSIAAFCGLNGDYNAVQDLTVDGGTIEYAYATGSVIFDGSTNPTDKGFVGIEYGTNSYTNNFFDSQTSGQSSDAVGAATAKTTAEMQDVATFTNISTSAGLTFPVWDFVNNPNDDGAFNDYWDMDQAGTLNNGYPILTWQQGGDQSLPVNLAAFSVLPGDGQVTLKWTTASEVNNKAFLVERSEDGEQFSLVTQIEGQGNKNSRTDYIYTDVNVFNGVTYHYRLSDMDYNGKITQLQTIAVTPQAAVDGREEITISDFRLYPAYPNPFNPLTRIMFDVPQGSRVRLSVYDLTGLKVAELVNGYREAGRHSVTFDAARLASGMYIYRLQAERYSAAGRMLLIK